MTNVLFLDIDGVLNGHEWCHMKSGPRIIPRCAMIFDAALARAQIDGIVIVSTWRGWINRGLMTPDGFAKMLLSHGITANVTDCLPPGDVENRAEQITDYVNLHEIYKWAVLDDLLLGVPHQIRTNPTIGIEPRHISELVAFFGERA